ncbi:MAG: serine protease [Polyangiaceae bacterium]|nr:serine protease [Polyangiaceae bacterium]
MQHVRPARIAHFVLAASLAACGGSQPSWDDEFPPSQAASEPAPGKPKSPPGRFARAEVDEVLLEGPVWILKRIAPEEVIRNGELVGWRVTAMPNEWSHLAMRAGDVVTKVNGAAIERPEDLWAVWVGLASAKELRIAYEQGGVAKELVMPIDGPPNEAVLAKLQSNSAPRPAQQPKGTIVIEEGAPPPPDDEADAGGARESVSVSGGGKSGGSKDPKAGDRKGDKK